MSEELDTTEPVPSEEDELSTTPPNPALETEEDGGWKMPKPVFRKTSGYPPQGFAKASQDEVKESVDDDTSTASMEKPVDLVDVEPQPDIHVSDPGFTDSAAADIKPVKKGGAVKVFFTILGILLALFLVVAFLAVIYFLFFMPSYDTTF